jgi:hypothetical protein
LLAVSALWIADRNAVAIVWLRYQGDNVTGRQGTHDERNPSAR